MVIARIDIFKMQNEQRNFPSNILRLLTKAISQMRYW